VFGGKGGGKLYTKEAGFRTLFAHLGIVPEISTGHPEFVPLGTTGKKVWRVGGKASCEYQGKTYAVEFSGPGALGLPGYESDNVAGITAKARRQILKALWAKVSPILNTDQADDGSMDFTQDVETPKAIEVTAETAEAAVPSTAKQHDGSHDRLRKILAEAPDKQAFVEDVWKAIAEATTEKQLVEVGNALATMKAEYSNQVLSLIRPFYQARQADLKGATNG
jgi:hypothetical protein